MGKTMNHQRVAHHPWETRFKQVVVLAMWASLVVGGSILPAMAQETKAPVKKAPEQKFEDKTLTTKDGVYLRCTYYPGPESKQTVPIILVHDWDRNRSDLHQLALYLQRMKYSVIAPDLRGHGNSLQVANSNESIDRNKMRKAAIAAMVLDIEAAKSFLLKENNEGKVNIEQLGVIGTGFGASLALSWAIDDWNARSLPTYKMGQDVKGLVLVSPLYSFKGITINQAIRDVRVLSQLSVLIAVGGQDAGALRDAERVRSAFERAWGGENPDTVRFYAADTSLQGAALITPETGVDRWIAAFLDQRLVKQGERFPWTDRTSPLK
jgi:pimeloyl-ACP methyl ester carboxylesterase